MQKLRSFTDLSGEAEAALEDLAAVPRRHGANRSLIREGTRPDQVFLLLEGWAYRYKLLPDGRRQIVAYLIPGDLCDPQVFLLEAMDHSIGLLSDALVAAIPKRDMIAIVDRHPEIARAFWWSALVDEAVLREWLVNVAQRDAYRRIAHLFCELWLRMSQVGLTRGGRFDLPLTQEQLGDTVGLTPVHVNRTLRRMRDDGLIEVGSRQLTILDVDQLRAIAGFDPKYLHLARRG